MDLTISFLPDRRTDGWTDHYRAPAFCGALIKDKWTDKQTKQQMTYRQTNKKLQTSDLSHIRIKDEIVSDAHTFQNENVKDKLI